MDNSLDSGNESTGMSLSTDESFQKKSTKKKGNDDVVPHLFLERLEKLQEQVQAEKLDACEIFGKTEAAELRELPPSLRGKAKCKLMEVLQRYAEEIHLPCRHLHNYCNIVFTRVGSFCK